MEKSISWIRRDEDQLARELHKKNIEIANAVQREVHPRISIYSRGIKRLFDLSIAFIALVVTLPINTVIGIITLKDVGLPIFYRQQRVGKDENQFTLVKFRNMTNEKDENGELLPPSERVTKTGKVLRKYSLDELLNFWSVLKGDMSIIGPRPLPVEYCKRLSKRHNERHKVKPGLLCPITKEIKEKYPFPEPYSRYQAEFETEIWYVENISFKTDVRLLGLLIKETFDMERRGKNAQSASPFIGYDSDGYAVSRKHYENKTRSNNNEI